MRYFNRLDMAIIPKMIVIPTLNPKIRQGCGFLVSGGIAFIIDAGTLLLLERVGVPLLMGRIVSIGLAMAAAWWLNRTLTFCVTDSPSWREFANYSTLAIGVAVINYGLFLVFIKTQLILHPFLATIMATAGSMIVSFVCMKFRVFKKEQ